MKTLFLKCAFALLSLMALNSQAQIFADKVINSGPCNPVTVSCFNGVINPKAAVDTDTSNYATIQTQIGVANSSYLALQFSQLGIPGMGCVVTIQGANGAICPSVLQNLVVTLTTTAAK